MHSNAHNSTIYNSQDMEYSQSDFSIDHLVMSMCRVFS